MFSYLNFIINSINFGFGRLNGVWQGAFLLLEACLAIFMLICLLGFLATSVVLEVNGLILVEWLAGICHMVQV